MGIEEKKFGFGMGIAPRESKPTHPMDSSLVGKKEEHSNIDRLKNSVDSTVVNTKYIYDYTKRQVDCAE